MDAPTPMPPQPAAFVPDLTQTPEENIERFWQHMSAINPAFASLLREGVAALTPLPEGQQRATRRSRFNARVVQMLESSTSTPGGTS